MPHMGEPPPGATTFIVGDPNGGNGWLVQKPDGTAEMFYVELPQELGIEREFRLDKRVRRHLGQKVPG